VRQEGSPYEKDSFFGVIYFVVNKAATFGYVLRDYPPYLIWALDKRLRQKLSRFRFLPPKTG
jgi:hypothetical protein